MAKKIKLELTEAQMRALIDCIDTISTMMPEDTSLGNVRLLDRMLKTNGYKRQYN
jgi:hypothetical protein